MQPWGIKARDEKHPAEQSGKEPMAFFDFSVNTTYYACLKFQENTASHYIAIPGVLIPSIIPESLSKN